MIELILIGIAIYIATGKPEQEREFEEDIEQPPISEFGELDDKNWGKPYNSPSLQRRS